MFPQQQQNCATKTRAASEISRWERIVTSRLFDHCFIDSLNWSSLGL